MQALRRQAQCYNTYSTHTNHNVSAINIHDPQTLLTVFFARPKVTINSIIYAGCSETMNSIIKTFISHCQYFATSSSACLAKVYINMHSIMQHFFVPRMYYETSILIYKLLCRALRCQALDYNMQLQHTTIIVLCKTLRHH